MSESGIGWPALLPGFRFHAHKAIMSVLLSDLFPSPDDPAKYSLAIPEGNRSQQNDYAADVSAAASLDEATLRAIAGGYHGAPFDILGIPPLVLYPKGRAW